MDFGTKVRVMRVVRNMTQRDLAQVSGVENTDLSRVETGKMLPSPEMERRIRLALRWPMDAEKAFLLLEEGEVEYRPTTE